MTTVKTLLVGPGDTHFQARSIGKVHNVIDHTVLFAPLGLSTSTRRIVTFLGTDDTGVTLRKALKAGIAIALAKALVCLAVAMDTINSALKIELQMTAKIIVQGNLVLTQ